MVFYIVVGNSVDVDIWCFVFNYFMKGVLYDRYNIVGSGNMKGMFSGSRVEVGRVDGYFKFI